MPGDIGFGTQLQGGDTAGTAFSAIANVFDLSGPELDRDDVEVTTYDSIDRYREYIPGLREGGEITATINLVSTDASMQQLYHSTAAQTTAGPASSTSADIGSFESNTNRVWRIVGPNTDFWQFNGYTKGIVQAQPIDDRRTWEVTFKVSGRPVYGFGAATTP